MTDLARRFAAYEDVLDAPEQKVAEVLAGALHLIPRPAGPHAAATSSCPAMPVKEWGRHGW